jgi:hypothetical protein
MAAATSAAVRLSHYAVRRGLGLAPHHRGRDAGRRCDGDDPGIGGTDRTPAPARPGNAAIAALACRQRSIGRCARDRGLEPRWCGAVVLGDPAGRRRAVRRELPPRGWADLGTADAPSVRHSSREIGGAVSVALRGLRRTWVLVCVGSERSAGRVGRRRGPARGVANPVACHRPSVPLHGDRRWSGHGSLHARSGTTRRIHSLVAPRAMPAGTRRCAAFLPSRISPGGRRSDRATGRSRAGS